MNVLSRNLGLKLDLKFEEFKVGQTFKSLIDKDDFQKYISFAKTKNILHEKPELAAKEGIKGTLLPGRAIIARAEIVWIKPILAARYFSKSFAVE